MIPGNRNCESNWQVVNMISEGKLLFTKAYVNLLSEIDKMNNYDYAIIQHYSTEDWDELKKWGMKNLNLAPEKWITLPEPVSSPALTDTEWTHFKDSKAYKQISDAVLQKQRLTYQMITGLSINDYELYLESLKMMIRYGDVDSIVEYNNQLKKSTKSRFSLFRNNSILERICLLHRQYYHYLLNQYYYSQKNNNTICSESIKKIANVIPVSLKSNTIDSLFESILDSLLIEKTKELTGEKFNRYILLIHFNEFDISPTVKNKLLTKLIDPNYLIPNNSLLRYELDRYLRININNYSIYWTLIDILLQKNNVVAKEYYAKGLRDGKGKKKDLEKSIEIMSELWENGCTEISLDLFDSIFVSKNESLYPFMIRVIQPNLDSHDPAAIMRLARAYKEGKGVDKDISQSKKLMQKAIKLSNNASWKLELDNIENNTDH